MEPSSSSQVGAVGSPAPAPAPDPFDERPQSGDGDLLPGNGPTNDGHGIGRAVFEWVGLVVLALIIALLIKTFLFQAFYIPSESMVPTLKVNDRVLVNKLSYKLHPVHRDDIVVFKAPKDSDPGIQDLVKRVIGLPGDTVEGHGGHVYINGKLLPEPYLPNGTTTSDFPRYKVPPASYWVMGDNRGNSKDSREFDQHFIPKHNIVGRVFVRIWPLSRLDVM